MISFDLDIAMDDPAYPGLGIAGTFIEIQRYLEKLTEVVPYAQDQELVRLKAAIKRAAISREALEEKIQEVEWIAGNVVPRFFVGSFIIALWAAYEKSVMDIAGWLRVRSRVRLKLDDLRDSNVNRKLALYCETVIGKTFSLPAELSLRLEQLYDVRNCLAHANGHIASQNDRRRESLEKLINAKRGIAAHDGSLVVSPAFAQQSFQDAADAINAYLRELHKMYGSESTGGS